MAAIGSNFFLLLVNTPAELLTAILLSRNGAHPTPEEEEGRLGAPLRAP
jgi:hypothetical protein